MEGREIIAASHSPFDRKRDVPENILFASFASVFLKAWGARTIEPILNPRTDFTGVLIAEGRKGAISAGNLHIIRMPIEGLDEVSEMFLNQTANNALSEESDQSLMFFALGSPVFCQDVHRFGGLNSQGKIEESMTKFVDQIGHMKPADVRWVDTKIGDEIHQGNLIAMFSEAKQNGQIPG